ncbi:hypothetical protein K7X08_034729 [Anisodus acutangulus]|uniref:COBRA-like protein n=1 Tax=Anisodus acutangulus TaxID=402998 RepID=A0A9Q1R1X1_9SOLA|nr:hypothetical protein K7X08_034729 [Anisodus acutangulus]
MGILDAYDALDPNGNITVKWDVKSWTPYGYISVVTIYNFQKYHHIQAPGWKLGWTWAKKEVIWGAVGGQATEQGDCSRFKGNIPHCCKRDPTIVDLLPGTPYNQQIANCCKGGVISSWVQDPEKAVSAFQLTVGQAGTSNKTVRLPKNFTLKAPGPGYTCGPATKGKPTKFPTPDGRRFTQALMTWNVTCTYSQFLAQKTPTCCVSLSSFYNNNIINCPTCACSCQNNLTHPGTCVDTSNEYRPLVQCTPHMCPIRVHWHVKTNYKAYWRWNLVVQHPNFDNLTQIFSFNYDLLVPYGSINDTAMFWGIKYYNDLLMQSGPSGNVQSEVILQKDKSKFTFENGWAFPHRVYFNGDNCVMPPSDAYPYLPNASAHSALTLIHALPAILISLILLYSHNL